MSRGRGLWEYTLTGRTAYGRHCPLCLIVCKNGKECTYIPQRVSLLEYINKRAKIVCKEKSLSYARLFSQTAFCAAAPSIGFEYLSYSVWARHKNNKATYAGRSIWFRVWAHRWIGKIIPQSKYTRFKRARSACLQPYLKARLTMHKLCI